MRTMRVNIFPRSATVATQFQGLMRIPYVLALLCFIAWSNAHAETMSYDAVGRLTSVTYSDGSIIIYTYDSNGNRLQRTSTSGPCPRRQFASSENSVIQAYVAYYGRPPDVGGLAYWAGRLEDEGGALGSIIDAFGESEEFEANFGDLSNTQLVTNLYQQLFSRDPEQGGLEYWVGELDAGRRTLQSVALDVLFGAQNEDAETVGNREELSQFYVTGVERGVMSSNLTSTQLGGSIANVSNAAASLTASCDSLRNVN